MLNKLDKMEKYKVQRNSCRCHPETCCCNDWCIVTNDGTKHSTYPCKGTAEEVADALNNVAVITRKDLHEMFGDNLIPDYDFGKISVCPACGLALGGVMGYVCNHEKCPTGLGGVFC